ncbi:MAG: c-type cytochrome biogenesis protein CcmI [Methylobacter sp.]|nr:c-type cytochrome biogenesis protein CcmI [Methylobacter sp.]MDP2097452.1 c-type cytochrome biogenesis protein CcmI [Methylobacter sp.]MDP2428648.1 c-type cytochrome biogenesis protein CcmI [Methylobacter sp.]MDP3056484.1 c-type cytochrome biogenesis protein CcmI [Methylobacter sp.]MDP3363230.1 c-type cytochrome biogenesis protein CcmI [Methylobacter sp.]
MLFLLIASVLVLSAFVIVLPPLWRKQPLAAADLDQRNVAIARQRLAELKEQLQAGALSQALYDEQLAELELALSDDLDIVSQVTAPSSSSGQWMAPVLIFAIPLLAGSLYWSLGNYPSLAYNNQTAAINQRTPELEQMKAMVAGLAERLKKQPDDAMGWTMLGRSYKYLEQHAQAADAFGHAYKLTGDQPEIMLLYADALAFANDEQMAGKPEQLVFKALALEPDNMTGLWLGGMAKAQTGEFVAAMALWKKLEALLPPGSESQQEIQVLLAKLAAQIPEGTVMPEAELASAVSIEIQVSLTPELQKLANPDDTVFVYAQALSGAKMPLAIVRKQVSELPLTVSLTDAMAMMPTTAMEGGSAAIGREPMRPMKLSNFGQVKLLARISKSGDAMQHPGDLIGVIEQVALTDKSLHKIVINSQIK